MSLAACCSDVVICNDSDNLLAALNWSKAGITASVLVPVAETGACATTFKATDNTVMKSFAYADISVILTVNVMTYSVVA